MADAERIAELEGRIRYHQGLYYNGAPEISDAEFDRLWDELGRIDPQNVLLQRIGADSDAQGVKRRHIIYMHSLSKASDPESFRRWSKAVPRPRYLVQYKMDGAGIELQYECGEFQLAVTRGDGEVGDDITVNARRMQGFVPVVTPDFSGGVRGEVIMLRSVHRQRYSDKANCRNTAVGIMKRKDGIGSNDLIIVVYDAHQRDAQRDEQRAAQENEQESEQENGQEKRLFDDQIVKLEWLEQQAFRVVKTRIIEDGEAIIVYRDEVMSLRESLDFDIDGLVVKAPEIDAEDVRNARPENQIAFKFVLEEQIATVRRIEWSVSGASYTPVAVVDPVLLAGTTVRRASMANPRLLREMGLRIGSRVAVSKRGEIIPKIERLVENPLDSQEIEFPTQCDACGSQLVDGETRLYCPNALCPRHRLHRIRRWLVLLGIRDFGEKLITQLFESGRVTCIADLYGLQPEDIASLERRGERSATKVLRNLYAIDTVSLERFIAGFQIEGVGELIIGRAIAGGFDTLERLRDADPAQLAIVEGIGEITAQTIISGIQALYGDMQALLRTKRIAIASPQSAERGGALVGQSFCFTGKLESMKRSEAQQLAQQQGATIRSSVVRDLDYLVTNNPAAPSSKLRQAAEYGVEVIDEATFLRLAQVKTAAEE